MRTIEVRSIPGGTAEILLEGSRRIELSMNEISEVIDGLERHVAAVRGPTKFENAGPFGAGEVRARRQADGVAIAVTCRGRGWAGVGLDQRGAERLLEEIKNALRG